jgi:hypothetical protein
MSIRDRTSTEASSRPFDLDDPMEALAQVLSE